MNWLKKNWWVAGLLIALAVTLFSPLASSSPDGLDRVAEDHGFAERARTSPFNVIADYVFPGIESDALATIVAGVVGTLLVFGLTWGLARLARSRG